MIRAVSNEVLRDRIDSIGVRISELSIQNEVRRKEVNERLDQVIETMNRGYVTRVEYNAMTGSNEKEHSEFVPLNRYLTVERIVYSLAGFILLSFMGALAALIFKAGLFK